MDKPRIAFICGDCELAGKVLAWLVLQDMKPEMIDTTSRILSPLGIRKLKEFEPDYILSVHFPHILPPEILAIPKKGCINLHPAYLPWNKGWHTPSWALLDGTPAGATLHFMDEGIDTGPIIARKEVRPSPDDTTHTLYAKILAAEFELFKETWPKLLSGDYVADLQNPDGGNMHHKKDLAEVQEITIYNDTQHYNLIRKLRALTTNDISEAAYFIEDGRKFRVQVKITEEV